MKSLRWIVPLPPSEIGAEPDPLVVTITKDLEIVVQGPVSELRLPSLAACQLGQALQDASAVVGQERGRAMARGRR